MALIGDNLPVDSPFVSGIPPQNGIDGSNSTERPSPTYALEQVAAILQPFDFVNVSGAVSGRNGTTDNLRPVSAGESSREISVQSNPAERETTDDDALGPIRKTNGLVFPYTPSISEGVSIKYDSVDLTHTNESYMIYKSTDSVRITLSDCIFTCDTFDNALYAMSVLHFLRAYSFMDFGRFRSGRPPSPMWFSAYGSYAYHRVPVLMEKADWTLPNDFDYIGIPEPGSPEYQTRTLAKTKSTSGKYTWLPIKFTVSSISLIVQHSPQYWINWSLDDYKSGRMLKRGFHTTGPSSVQPR